MSTHQCPKCELRFDWKTELDYHCRQEHPQFRHEYPAAPVTPPVETTPRGAAEPRPAHEQRHLVDDLGRWLTPSRRHD